MTRRIYLRIPFLLAALALVSCAPATEVPDQPTALATNTPALVSPTEEPAMEPTADVSAVADGRVVFEQLGISLEVPEAWWSSKTRWST